ncbi:MAG: methylenetetrahydrofolate--tRNA-(uracil(54)-C(5))-methyltransferase (FADH(2)-oxidizing) TrmFO [Oligoflexales bacterium]|nr:methylenetetrahydrofolate--tRNA-(uracil(54)-C(5))-methyltransferase (FADH(2)-oxidizing) TrmFO [Oligoflexales bacterium]
MDYFLVIMNEISEMEKKCVHIVGGGLAGVEAAWQCLKRGSLVVMHEMRPGKKSEAHRTGDLAELICSNSLKSENPDSAHGLLKFEMKMLDSLVIVAAELSRVPAGKALAVDRKMFSAIIKEKLLAFPKFSLVEEEVRKIPSEEEIERSGDVWILATGPLTSEGLEDELKRLCGGEKKLFFYDAIAPTIQGESIDTSKVFWGNRYEGSLTGDYLNIPLSKNDYYKFVDEVESSDKIELHDFEEPKYFESCLPIEVMIERGRETLRFGPMKPQGLVDPNTGLKPYANIQLRKENRDGTIFSMVGFQTKMKWTEQMRIFKKLPGLENAEFVRFGSIHRNTFLHSPSVLNRDLSFRSSPSVFLAGQITGVEGYVESSATGLLAGLSVVSKLEKKSYIPPPGTTMMGALLEHITSGFSRNFQPMNANLGILTQEFRGMSVKTSEKRRWQCNNARDEMLKYKQSFWVE